MPPLNRTQKMNIVELQRMNILDLQELAKKLEVVDCTSLRKQELIFSILKHQTRAQWADLCSRYFGGAGRRVRLSPLAEL